MMLTTSYQPFCLPSNQKGGGFAEFLEKKKPKPRKKAKSLGVVKIKNQSGQGKIKNVKANSKCKKSINIKKAQDCQNYALRDSKYAKTKTN